MGSVIISVTLLPFCFLLFILLPSRRSYAVYNITSSSSFSKGQTISSPRGIYELGFFSPNNSQNQYVGIWYKSFSPQIVVWVANREKPVTDSAANLTISSNGNLVLMDGKNSVVWSSTANATSKSLLAELLDNGNFVLRDLVSGGVLWESFNDPCDTILPGSKLMNNLKTGEKHAVLTSWKSDSDPSLGNYVSEILPQVPAQIFIRKGSRPYWRTGPWSKTKFVGIPEMDASYLSSFDVDQDINVGTISLSFKSYEDFVLTYVVMSAEGSLKVMRNEGNGWDVNWEAPDSLCDLYGTCGLFGVCIKSEPPTCKCLKGFEPKSDQEWNRGNWTKGCVRRTQLLCEKSSSTDMFFPVSRTKLPDLYENVMSWDVAEVCHQECLNICSCLAYAFVDGIGCLIWKQDLIDTVKFSSGGEDLFIRLARSEFGDRKQTKILIASLTTISVITISGLLIYGFCRWRRTKQCDTSDRSKGTSQEYTWRSDLKEDVSGLHFFDIHTIQIATDNFSISNKLGQGGFGPVFKGKLPDGKEIAAKRLSSNSGQCIEEFKNEIMLISKLQHRNLVRLLGCCIEKEERIIIYEFMINKSLDCFLFGPMRRELDWEKRLNIIQGIARGLLYLHRNSCIKVVHRDLKVSNILLDEKMNPRISDFGLARMFQGTQELLANTHRVVGTLGYMSPEYALGGMFSEKSDVYSFGVLLLEIVSGRKTTSFSYDEQSQSLLAYAWKSWCETEGLNLADQALADSYAPSEVKRCVHIALLCVQDQVVDRPNMLQVVSMLSSETQIPQPKQPTFTFQNALKNRDDGSQFEKRLLSVYEITDSMIEGR